MTQHLSLAEFGAALSCEARASLLCVLMDGRAFTVKELASHVGLAPSTASEHLSRLTRDGLTRQIASGRCSYHVIANEDVADMLEQLGRITAMPGPSTRAPAHLHEARCCYNHLAGRLGVELAEALRRDGRILTEGEGWALSAMGRDWAARFGVTAVAVKFCLDWSERKSHMSGPFATALLTALLEREILARHGSGRGLVLRNETEWQRVLTPDQDASVLCAS